MRRASQNVGAWLFRAFAEHMPHQEMVAIVNAEPKNSHHVAGLPKILRLPLVTEATGLSRSSIYAFVAKGTFPQPVRLGARAVGWKEADLLAWMDSRKVAGV